MASSRPRSAAGSGRCFRIVFEGAPLDELHGQERPAIGEGADLVDGRNAGMLQLAGDARLAEEALGGWRIGRVALGQQLDGDVAIEGDVAGAVDDAHAAVADLVKQLVARRAERRDGRLGAGRSGRVCQVFGHGIPFPGLQRSAADGPNNYDSIYPETDSISLGKRGIAWKGRDIRAGTPRIG